MTREERRQEKSERKERRKNRRPSRIRAEFSKMSGGVQSVREIYREMNMQLKGEYPDDAGNEEDETSRDAAVLKHTRGVFKIKAAPKTRDVLGFMMDHEMRTLPGWIGCIIDVSVFILFIVSLFSGNGYSILLLFGILILTVFVVGPLSHLVTASAISKRACSKEGSAVYSFSSVGFDIRYQSGEYASFTWDELYRAQESNKAFYIYLSEGDGFLITKTDIAAAGRKPEQFENLLESHAGDRFKKYYFRPRKA